MQTNLKKRGRQKQESFLFILMGFILIGLLVSGYFLFVDKILPGISSSTKNPQSEKSTTNTKAAAIPAEIEASAQPTEQIIPGEGQVITLYFGTRGKDSLYKEIRKIPSEKLPMKLAECLLKELLRGPSNPEARAVIPPGTQLRSFFLHQGTFFVDFSRELVENHPGGPSEEILTVYSIVNTLTELDHKYRVRFLVNGSEVETLKGHIALKQSLTRYESINTDFAGG